MSQVKAEKYSQFFDELAKSTRHPEVAITARGPVILDTTPSIAHSYPEIINDLAYSDRLSVIRASPSTAKDMADIVAEVAKYTDRELLGNLDDVWETLERINDLDRCTRKHISLFQTKFSRHIAEAMSRGVVLDSRTGTFVDDEVEKNYNKENVGAKYLWIARSEALFVSSDPKCGWYVDDEVEKCYHETEAHVKHFKVEYKRLMGVVLYLIRYLEFWLNLAHLGLTRKIQEKEEEKEKLRPLFRVLDLFDNGDDVVDVMINFCRFEVDLMENWGAIARTVENTLERKFRMQAIRSHDYDSHRLI